MNEAEKREARLIRLKRLEQRRRKVMESLEGKGVYIVSAPVMALLMEAFESAELHPEDSPFTVKEAKLVRSAFPQTKRNALAKVRVSYAYEQTGRR